MMKTWSSKVFYENLVLGVQQHIVIVSIHRQFSPKCLSSLQRIHTEKYKNPLFCWQSGGIPSIVNKKRQYLSNLINGKGISAYLVKKLDYQMSNQNIFSGTGVFHTGPAIYVSQRSNANGRIFTSLKYILCLFHKIRNFSK